MKCLQIIIFGTYVTSVVHSGTDYLYNNTITYGTYGTRVQLSKMTMPSTIATFVDVGVFLEKATDMAINSPKQPP